MSFEYLTNEDLTMGWFFLCVKALTRKGGVLGFRQQHPPRLSPMATRTPGGFFFSSVSARVDLREVLW